MCACANVDESKADRRTEDRGMKKRGEEKKIPSFSLSVSGYFPRFHKQVLRSGKQHIEREMEGRRRKLDEKRGGSTGL